jgi:hypothetical protein
VQLQFSRNSPIFTVIKTTTPHTTPTTTPPLTHLQDVQFSQQLEVEVDSMVAYEVGFAQVVEELIR